MYSKIMLLSIFFYFSIKFYNQSKIFKTKVEGFKNASCK